VQHRATPQPRPGKYPGYRRLLEYKAIAAGLDRDPSVISHEVGRHGGRADYQADRDRQGAAA
jgi:hypothetical protein